MPIPPPFPHTRTGTAKSSTPPRFGSWAGARSRSRWGKNPLNFTASTTEGKKTMARIAWGKNLAAAPRKDQKYAFRFPLCRILLPASRRAEKKVDGPRCLSEIAWGGILPPVVRKEYFNLQEVQNCLGELFCYQHHGQNLLLVSELPGESACCQHSCLLPAVLQPAARMGWQQQGQIFLRGYSDNSTTDKSAGFRLAWAMSLLSAVRIGGKSLDGPREVSRTVGGKSRASTSGRCRLPQVRKTLPFR